MTAAAKRIGKLEAKFQSPLVGDVGATTVRLLTIENGALEFQSPLVGDVGATEASSFAPSAT